jgi:hypothetical protein
VNLNSSPDSPPAWSPSPDGASNPYEGDAGPASDTSPPVSYHYTQPVNVNGVPIGSAKDFLLEGVNDFSPLGFALRPDRRRLNSGETLSGLTIIAIQKGGAAAQAGLRPFKNPIKKAFELASIAGALFFPPVMMLAPIFDASKTGDHYDMIVGIDGYRVRDALDFADCMRDLQPNQPVYLSLVRDGVRKQLQLKMPDFDATN